MIETVFHAVVIFFLILGFSYLSEALESSMNALCLNISKPFLLW